jgi:hypothetical protein
MISEILEEAGIDREKARQFRRQMLQGIIMLCQWQLERMDATAAASPRPAGRKPRKVTLD